MIRLVSERDAAAGRAALEGLKRYEQAPRPEVRGGAKVVARVGPARLQDHGGSGPAAVLVPSLINPPHVLDLDPEVSLTRAVARMNRRALLLDWGPASERIDLSIAGHVEHLLVPVLEQIGEPATLIGYCLGGTMSIAASALVPVERLVTLASPWHFDGYPASAREALARLWTSGSEAARQMGALPMEVLQAGFWSLDPERSVTKFARFGALSFDSPEARRFVALEDWANEGEPLPYPAARELFEDFFAANLPGTGRWEVAGRTAADRLSIPALHCTAAEDRITPAEAAPRGDCLRFDAGHVGMIVGSRRHALHQALRQFLDPLAAAQRDG